MARAVGMAGFVPAIPLFLRHAEDFTLAPGMDCLQLDAGAPFEDGVKPSRKDIVGSLKGRFGSRTEIPGSFGTSGYLRIAALGLTSQVCHEGTFLVFA